MRGNEVVLRFPQVLLVISVMTAFPSMGTAADDTQAQRELRRIDDEARREREDEQARRDMASRELAQAEALRGQEEAIRRMETTQSRLEANSQRLAQQSADQAQMYNYPRYSYSVPITPLAPAMPLPDALHGDAVAGMQFAPVSERLKSYFGTASGVLVVSAGGAAPFGLQDGDVIISIDGRVPADGPHVARILGSYRPGERLKLRLQRDHRVIDLDATAPAPRSN